MIVAAQKINKNYGNYSKPCKMDFRRGNNLKLQLKWLKTSKPIKFVYWFAAITPLRGSMCNLTTNNSQFSTTNTVSGRQFATRGHQPFHFVKSPLNRKHSISVACVNLNKYRNINMRMWAFVEKCGRWVYRLQSLTAKDSICVLLSWMLALVFRPCFWFFIFLQRLFACLFECFGTCSLFFCCCCELHHHTLLFPEGKTGYEYFIYLCMLRIHSHSLV